MANPANQLNQKENMGSGNINPVLNKVRDASKEIEGQLPDLKEKMGEYTEQGRQILSDVRERAGELYDISSGWVQENRLITTLSVAAIVGVVGFFIGRGRRDI